jgi:hypothetical protein
MHKSKVYQFKSILDDIVHDNSVDAVNQGPNI